MALTVERRRSLEYQAWTAQVLRSMETSGPQAEAALQYIRQRRTRISVHDQPTGARWTVDRRIEVHPRFVHLAPGDPYTASLIIHEVRHLQQGMLTALSVYGELQAWQLQFLFLHSRLGYYHDDPRRNAVIRDLVSLPFGWDRTILEKARGLMQEYAGKRYRVDLLPLYPLHREVRFRITHHQPNRNSGHGLLS